MCVSGINILHSLYNSSIFGWQKDFQRVDLCDFALLLWSPKQVFLSTGSPSLLGGRDQNVEKFIAVICNKNHGVNVVCINR